MCDKKIKGKVINNKMDKDLQVKGKQKDRGGKIKINKLFYYNMHDNNYSFYLMMPFDTIANYC